MGRVEAVFARAYQGETEMRWEWKRPLEER